MTRSIVAAKQLRKKRGREIQGAAETLKRGDGVECLRPMMRERGAAFGERHNARDGDVVLVETSVLVRERREEYKDLD